MGSADLEALLASLRIGGRAPGGEAKHVNYARVWDSASPGAAPAAAVAPAAVAPPPPPPPPRAVESEVIDLVSSDDEAEAFDLEDGEEAEVVIIAEEEDWVIAAPATGRKPRRDLVESSESSSESGSESGSESESSGSESGSESESSGSDDYGAADVAAAAPPALLPSLAAVLPPGTRAPPAAPPRRAPPPANASAPTPAKAAATFRRDRAALSAAVFADLNARVFGGRLPADLSITWNARLATTAGLTHYARPAAGAPTARVELSAKVVDSAARLERTLAHELCHAAAWLLDGVAKPPHGAAFKVRSAASLVGQSKTENVLETNQPTNQPLTNYRPLPKIKFKAWAARVVAAAPHLEVSTCHAYVDKIKWIYPN
jgi:predicted SprT family Zn-dependent metalloprotease